MLVDPDGGCTVGVDCPKEFDWMGQGTTVLDEFVGTPKGQEFSGTPYFTMTNFFGYDFRNPPTYENKSMVSEFKPNFFGRQKESLIIRPGDKVVDVFGKTIGNILYDIGDDALVSVTSFAAVQDVTGLQSPIHLDGSGAVRGTETVNAGVNTLLTLVPWAKSTKVLNAAQYSKAFNIKGISHQARGEMIKNHNNTNRYIEVIKRDAEIMQLSIDVTNDLTND